MASRENRLPNREQDLHLTLHSCKKLSFLLIFLYNAKPSFEIAKWMAKDMLWQNMKINEYMLRGRPPFGASIRDVGFQVCCMMLLIVIFCHSIFLAIHFAISKDGLALYKKISKKSENLKAGKVR